MNLRTDLKPWLRRDVRLALYSTMQVGGTAQYFAEPTREEELMEALDWARHENLPVTLLGKGSNVIFPEEGYKGLVITLLHYQSDLLRADLKKCLITASAGTHLYRLVLATRDAGLGGAEFLANVPGTLGGALVMNAGFSRFPRQFNEIGDLVQEVHALEANGKRVILEKKDLQFSYRRSNLEGKIILQATLQLWRRKKETIQREIQANFDYRNQKQDMRFPSSGSIFKNPDPPTPTAGQLIEKLGLKSLKVGGAQVSDRHGNYIVNTGGAKSSDIVQLIQKIQKAVLDATGILLEPEVRIIRQD